MATLTGKGLALMLTQTVTGMTTQLRHTPESSLPDHRKDHQICRTVDHPLTVLWQMLSAGNRTILNSLPVSLTGTANVHKTLLSIG